MITFSAFLSKTMVNGFLTLSESKHDLAQTGTGCVFKVRFFYESHHPSAPRFCSLTTALVGGHLLARPLMLTDMQPDSSSFIQYPSQPSRSVQAHS